MRQLSIFNKNRTSHIALVSTCLALALGWSKVLAKDEVVEQITKREAINLMLGDTSILSKDEQDEIAKRMINYLEQNQALMSSMHDQVEPIREPIYISTDPAAEPSVIYVTPSRPTTVSFFKQGGGSLPVVRILEQDIGAEKPRFETKPIEGMTYAYSFKTSVRTGWTTVDFFFEGVPYSIPIKLVAGNRYHSSAQAVLIESPSERSEHNANNSSGSNTSSDASLEEVESTPGISNMMKTLYAFANYNQPPKEGTYSPVDVTFFSSTSMSQPRIVCIRTTIDGGDYYLLRTNGLLTHPDYTASEPANTPSETIWAYAIPADNVSNLISVSYKGSTHLVNLSQKNSIGLAISQ